MVAYNFHSRFANMVKFGKKRQSIRAKGKRRHVCEGGMLQLFTGMQTDFCTKLIETPCLSISPILISREKDCFTISVAGVKIVNLDEFAFAEGFADFEEMLDWIVNVYELPFEGVLIKW